MLTEREAEEFVHRNWDKAQRIISNRARFCWSADRDQVISDGNLALWEAARTYDPSKSEEGAHLASIIKFRLIDLWRERSPGVRGRAVLPTYVPLIDEHDQIPDPTDLIQEFSDALSVAQILEDLPPRFRQRLIEYFLDERLMQDLAKARGITESAISKRIKEAVMAARDVAEKER